MRNKNNSNEYNQALNFLKTSCKCSCSDKLPKEKFAQLRSDFQSLSKSEQDIFVMANLTTMDEGDSTTSSRFPKRERTNKRTFYRWDNKNPICLETYLNMLGISHIYLESIRNHLINKGLVPRIHGNRGKMPQWKTKLNVDQEIRETIKDFILNYAEEHGQPDPRKGITFLPTEMTYKSVHRDFIAIQKEDDQLKSLKFGIFLKLWHQLTPDIKFRSPRSDLCDTCHRFWNELSNFFDKNEVEKEELKKRFLNHLNRAKLEREHYKQNARQAKEQRHLTKEITLIFGENLDHGTTDATAHYSFDWAQSIHIPYFSQQPSGIFFKTPYKVHLFGFQDEATREQTNYVIGENELLGKGSNGTLSLVFDAIRKLNRGEKYLKLTCDNCGGQNKNNITLWFCLYLVICWYYKIVELNFMVAGHTKFSPDGKFGMIKKLYWKSTVTCVDDFVEVVKRSSPQGLNKVQRYEKGKGFRYLDIKVLKKYFKELPNLTKYHHFHFSADRLGVVKVKEEADGEFKELNLWRDESRIAESIEEIRKMIFPILTPPPLKLERQIYLYEKIRPLVKEKCRDVICPKPNITSSEI